MKASFTVVFTILLIHSVAFSKAAKFPFRLRSPDCDFCTDFMLADCICADVEFCRSQSCYVPEECANIQCEQAENPRTEEETPTVVQEPEIVPATDNTLGNGSDEECQYCETMPIGCYCEDVDWCREKQCQILAQCEEECPQE